MKALERKINGTFSPVPGGYAQQINEQTTLFVPDFSAVRYDPQNRRDVRLRPGLPSVDANYLIDFLQLFPDGEAFTSEQKPYITPIFFRSADGEGILCPVRKPAKAAA